jgi:hypothetical protein
VEFFHKNEYVRSYSIYKHDTTLKMTFGANLFLDDFNSGPPSRVGACSQLEPGLPPVPGLQSLASPPMLPPPE